MKIALGERWGREGGYRELLVLALPLVLSTASWSIQLFVNRMFLAWYSREAIAAVVPASILNFSTMSIFIGTASYVGIIVAQYFGARQPGRIGATAWQGVYVALIGGVFHALMIPFAPEIFGAIGHDPAVQAYEIEYFMIINAGAFFGIASSAFAGFFTGIGKPWPVMWVNVAGTGVNILLDYLLVFGKGGFPELGVRGAAIATVVAGLSYCGLYVALLAKRHYRITYRSLAAWRPDGELFGRLMRFGLPSGVQFFVDIVGFNIFLLLVGRLGTDSLAATNIAFSINTLAFMPMIGIGIAVSVLMGQYLGADNPAFAGRSVWSGFHLTLLYMGTISLAYVLAPGVFIWPFAANAEVGEMGAVYATVAVLLRFVAVYSVFDTLNIVFASALKGAGDTRFVMYMLCCVSLCVLIVPTYLALIVFRAGIYTAWYIASAYVILLGFAFLLRFMGGKWRSMKVIGEPHPAIVSSHPAVPATEFEP
ncbi:MAG: MATE family efflux transporter [Spirochaetes bacterium]|nr:MAG: MATE family efflux transporter [Spirochaetota bacterium]